MAKEVETDISDNLVSISCKSRSNKLHEFELNICIDSSLFKHTMFPTSRGNIYCEFERVFNIHDKQHQIICKFILDKILKAGICLLGWHTIKSTHLCWDNCI